MKFSEMFFKEDGNNFTSYPGKKVKSLSNIGAVSFGRSITGYHEEMTPHYEMSRCQEMYDRNAIVQSGVNQLATYILPNKCIKIESKDERTRNFLTEWHKMRKGFLEEISNFLKTKMICGNGYLEQVYTKEGILDNVFSINDASRIYINPNAEEGEEKYIYELPVGIQSFFYMGKLRIPQYYKIQYMTNYNWSFRQIYGVTLDSDRVKHFKRGWSANNIYGKAPLASAIDADTIMDNILRSWNAISKNRMLSKKIISISDKISNDIEIDQDRLDQLQTKLEDDERAFHLFNVPLQILQTDVGTASTYDTMHDVMEYLRKIIMVSLLPQHMTPWSETGTTQGSSEAMPAFVMRLKSEQNQLIDFLNENVIGELRKSYPWLAEDATYVFDEPIVRASENYVFMAYSLVNGGILTPKQAQTYLKNIGVLDEKLFGLNEETPGADKDAATTNLSDENIKKMVVEWMSSGKLEHKS